MISQKALPAAVAAPLLVLALVSAARSEPMIFAGAGSNVPITRLLAEAFVKDRPGVVIDVPASIGSAGGIRAAVDGAVTLGLSSRPLRETEKGRNVSLVPYARTIVVIGVHPTVRDESLTFEDLVRIYRGRKTRWQDGTEIIVLNRNQDESTIDVMNEVIPGFREAHVESLKARRWIVAFTDQEMLKRLASTPQTVGMTDYGAIVSEHLSIKTLSLNGIAPTAENVRRGAYSLVKTLFFVVPGDGVPAEARAFISFAKSPAGRKILTENGYLAGE